MGEQGCFKLDSTCKSDTLPDAMNDVHSTEFLNGLMCSGLSNHKMILKVGTPRLKIFIHQLDHTMRLD